MIPCVSWVRCALWILLDVWCNTWNSRSGDAVTETPKQRRERLEVERAHERHAALERRLQEASERRAQMLYATRTAATLVATVPSPPVATSSSPFPQDGDDTNDEGREHSQAGVATTPGVSACTSHVGRETWAGRVLRSRGVKGSEHARSSALYSHILKSLRTKASKLRKRLAVEACVVESEDRSSSSCCDRGSLSCEVDTDTAACSSVAESAPVQGYTAESGLLQHYSHVAQV